MIGQMGYEWKKIIRRKSFVFLLAGFTALGLVLYGMRIYVLELGGGFRPANYRQAADDLMQMDTRDACAQAKETYEAILYEGRWPRQYGQSPREVYALYEVLCQELSQVSGHEAYIEGILENAKAGRGGFLSANTKNRRLNEKIFRDFSGLQGLSLEFTGSYGIARFMEADLWDVLFVMVLMIFVYALVITEYEEGKISLMRAAPKGRRTCFGAKLLLGLCFVLTLQTVVYLARLCLAVAAYGCPELAAPFQSVYGAGACPWRICVQDGILLFLGGKLLMSFFLYALLLLLALLCRSGRLFYGICLVGGAASLLCYTQIDTNSFLEKLKWLNPAAFLDTGRLLTEYRNLSVMDFPLGYPKVAACMEVLALPLFVFWSFRLYENSLPDRRILLTGSAGMLRNRWKSLWGMEHRKYWFHQALTGVYLAYLLLAVAVYTPLHERLYTKEEIYYKLYVTQAEGSYSEEKLQALYQERMRLEEIDALLESGENYHDSVITYYQKELERRSGLEPAIQHVEYVREKGDTVLYEKGFQQLLGQNEGRLALLLCRLGSLGLMCLFSVTIWHYDKRTGMERLIRISRTGSKRLQLHQYGNVLWGGCLIFAATYLPWIYNVHSAYSIDFPDAAARSLEMFAFLPEWISIRLLYAAFYGGHLLYLFAAGCLSKWVCGKINHYMGAALALFTAFMLPVILVYFSG